MNKSKSTLFVSKYCTSDDSKDAESSPDPTQFGSFMKWASKMLCLEYVIFLQKDGDTDDAANNSFAIFIQAIFDKNKNLVEIIFNEDLYKTVEVLKILELIVQFHPKLMTLRFKPRIDQNVINSLSHVLQASMITSVFLDGCFIGAANYYILLNEASSLKCLSLSRCLIDDKALELITKNLKHLKPASKTLRILIMSCNRITDVGAKMLASVLRCNRHLIHLNVSGNQISDAGAISILEALTTFELTKDELKEYRKRHLNFVKKKIHQETISLGDSTVTILKLSAHNTKKAQKHHGKDVKDKEEQREHRDLKERDIRKDTTHKDPEDPFADYIEEGEHKLVPGNYVLQSLNLAYNNLSYISIQTLLKVLSEQRTSTFWPQGLINVCIEGNYLPEKCEELDKIDLLLESKMTESFGGGRKKKKKLSRAQSTPHVVI